MRPTICKFDGTQPTEIQTLPEAWKNLSPYGNALRQQEIDGGWRYLVRAEHGARYMASDFADSGTHVIEVAIDYSDAEIAQQAVAAAAAEAAEAIAPRDVALGKATLRTYPDGSVELVSGPLIVPGTDAGAYEVWVDSETGLLLTALDHASPRKTKEEKDAAKAAKRAKIAAIKAAKTDKDKLAALLDFLGLK